MDFWGGHDFICTHTQCCTVGIGLGVGQCWGPTSDHSDLLQPGSDAHEDVAHALRTPRDPSQPHFIWQSEFPEASLQYKSLQVVHREGRYLKHTFLLQLNAGVSTAPGFCNFPLCPHYSRQNYCTPRHSHAAQEVSVAPEVKWACRAGCGCY